VKVLSVRVWFCLFRWNRSCSASASAYCDTFICSMVCPWTVWRIWMPFDRYTCGVQRHAKTRVPDHQRKRRFGGSTLSQTMQLQIAAATWRIKTRSDSTFYQITLVLVVFFCRYIITGNNCRHLGIHLEEQEREQVRTLSPRCGENKYAIKHNVLVG